MAEAAACSLGFSFESSSIDGSPLLSGVSCIIKRMMTMPIVPAMAAPKKPHCQPEAATIAPTKMKESHSPMLWLAEKKP